MSRNCSFAVKPNKLRYSQLNVSDLSGSFDLYFVKYIPNVEKFLSF
jgi:hypothetical protein